MTKRINPLLMALVFTIGTLCFSCKNECVRCTGGPVEETLCEDDFNSTILYETAISSAQAAGGTCVEE
ncbi:MAG: hypothetical protein AAFW73_01190 [Bacteroidota bacterium]